MRRGIIQTFRLDPRALNLSSGVATGVSLTILHVSIGVWGSNKMGQLPLSDICCFRSMFEEIGERAFLREASCFSLH